MPDDDDTEDEHPYEWLPGVLRANGIDASPVHLRRLPYVVELSQRLRGWVAEKT